ncbi:MAG: SpoIID/LytB domain-containing protein [Cyanophyceae cyanobacterium]
MNSSQTLGSLLRGLSLGLWLVLWLSLPASARQVLMRVGVAVNSPSVTLGSSTDARILDGQGQPIGSLSAMTPARATRSGSTVQVGAANGSRLFIQPSSSDGLVFINRHWYRGLVELIPGDQGVVAINQVGLDDYVSSVIGSEMGHRFPTEALRAQAVASRTYALFHRNLRLDRPYDLGVDEMWQVYKGVDAESNLTQAAARDTSSQVVTYNGELINAVFHSSSGGHTEDVANVWLEPLPYLKGVPDYDSNAPVFSWTVPLSSQQLQQAASGIGSITSVEVSQRSPFGRAMRVRIHGSQGQREISAGDFRVRMGLKSTMFTIGGSSATTASLAGGSAGFVVNGRGFGHGIGMSQWGAASLAQQGWSFQQILGHYYQGTSLAVLDPQ